jgi:hypothetical protein
MGIEYAIRFDVSDGDRVAARLRRLPDVRERPDKRFDLGPAADGWPTATVTVEPGGAYFCDHCGGGGSEQLGVVVAWLVGEFGPVTVSDL